MIHNILFENTLFLESNFEVDDPNQKVDNMLWTPTFPKNMPIGLL